MMHSNFLYHGRASGALFQMLEQLRKAGLKLKPTKYHFARQAVEYLGHVTTPDGLKPNPKQVSIIQDYPASESVSQVRLFLSMTSYYHHFIGGFAKIAYPLYSRILRSSGLRKKNLLWCRLCNTLMLVCMVMPIT